jgi:hypothetical protein
MTGRTMERQQMHFSVSSSHADGLRNKTKIEKEVRRVEIEIII